MSGDAEDELNAAVTHEKLDKLIEMVGEVTGRLEAIEAELDRFSPQP